jgi:hypothetical protein
MTFLDIDGERERDKAEKERNIDIPTIVYKGFMVLIILWTPITTACQHISGMSSAVKNLITNCF